MPDRYGHKSKWEEERENIESEAIWIGRDYMEGRKSIASVESYLNRTSHYSAHFTRSQIAKFINKGAVISEKEGKAKASRVQPQQEPMKFRPKRNAGAGGKLASRPEHTRYKPAKPATKRASTPRPRALNAYDVKTQRKQDLKVLLDKHTRGQVGVKEVKREGKAAAQGKAYKNVVYNETHHRYVGPNRPGGKVKTSSAPPKTKRAASVPTSPTLKKNNKYVVTYTQGGATHTKSTLQPNEAELRRQFKKQFPHGTIKSIQLVMRHD